MVVAAGGFAALATAGGLLALAILPAVALMARPRRTATMATTPAGPAAPAVTAAGPEPDPVKDGL
jgi:hypothetical protein